MLQRFFIVEFVKDFVRLFEGGENFFRTSSNFRKRIIEERSAKGIVQDNKFSAREKVKDYYLNLKALLS